MNLVSEISNNNLQNSSSNSEQLELIRMQLSSVKNKPIIADFDGGNISSDAGLIILKEVEKNIGIIKAIESVLEDKRDSRYFLLKGIIQTCLYMGTSFAPFFQEGIGSLEKYMA